MSQTTYRIFDLSADMPEIRMEDFTGHAIHFYEDEFLLKNHFVVLKETDDVIDYFVPDFRKGVTSGKYYISFESVEAAKQAIEKDKQTEIVWSAYKRPRNCKVLKEKPPFFVPMRLQSNANHKNVLLLIEQQDGSRITAYKYLDKQPSEIETNYSVVEELGRKYFSVEVWDEKSLPEIAQIALLTFDYNTGKLRGVEIDPCRYFPVSMEGRHEKPGQIVAIRDAEGNKHKGIITEIVVGYDEADAVIESCLCEDVVGEFSPAKEIVKAVKEKYSQYNFIEFQGMVVISRDPEQLDYVQDLLEKHYNIPGY